MPLEVCSCTLLLRAQGNAQCRSSEAGQGIFHPSVQVTKIGLVITTVLTSPYSLGIFFRGYATRFAVAVPGSTFRLMRVSPKPRASDADALRWSDYSQQLR